LKKGSRLNDTATLDSKTTWIMPENMACA